LTPPYAVAECKVSCELRGKKALDFGAKDGAAATLFDISAEGLADKGLPAYLLCEKGRRPWHRHCDSLRQQQKTES